MSSFVQEKKPVYDKASAKWKNLNMTLMKMIATDFQPFSIVEDQGFVEYSEALNQRYVLPSRNHLSQTLLPKLYEKGQIGIRRELENVK